MSTTAYRVVGVDRIFVPDLPASADGTWYGLTPQAADPTPVGFTSYLWLQTDGTLHLVMEGQDSVIATLLSSGFLAAPLQLTGTIYNTISSPKPVATSGRSGQFVRETIADNPAEHLYFCRKGGAGTYEWVEVTFT